MNTANLEARIQRLEDIEAIKNVTARYSFDVNKGWNDKKIDVEAMPFIFAKDAIWESKDMNTSVKGVEQIMLDLLESTKNVEFSMHSFTNPIIEVDGDTATGNWLFWVASRNAGLAPNEVFMSAYIAYVRTEKGWLIQTFNLHFGMTLHPQE